MRRPYLLLQSFAFVLILAFAIIPASAQEISSDLQQKIDKLASDTLARTGVPSASVAIVKNGQVVYTKAYGDARLDPKTQATPEMRYSIGSISKQFTAAAILLLAEQGKLSLDDKVAKFIPNLTRANEVTIRQLLSHTSGYQDYWPQDYVMPGMLVPTTAQQIVDGWAKKPLDFEPGTKWQYSNTNYVIAGLIVEKVAGVPLIDFLHTRIFTPLQMKSVSNIDAAGLGPSDAAGYMRVALAPVRPAPKEAQGWLFAAGELAMTARDLALWDISVINHTVLKPASYQVQQTDMLLKSGVATQYGLGVQVNVSGGRRRIAHGGEVSGYTTRNEIYPDDKAAIVVFTNLDATGASSQIATRIANTIFGSVDLESKNALVQAKAIFAGLQKGTIKASLFSDNAKAYFSQDALADFQSSLGKLGSPTEFVQTGSALRGGMTLRTFRIRAGGRIMNLTAFWLSSGLLEQYQVARAE